MKKPVPILIILIFAVNFTSAQGNYINTGISDLFGKMYREQRISNEAPDIQGTPYLSEDFKDGLIYYDGKFKVEPIPLRINLCLDELEYKDQNLVLAVAEPSKVDSAIIGNTTFIYLIEKNKSPVSGFVKVWSAEQPTLITKMNIAFHHREAAKPYGDPKPDRYKREKDRHYLLKSDGQVEMVTSVKKLIKELGDHQTELSSFAKEHKVSAGDAEDLQSLIKYYHSIL